MYIELFSFNCCSSLIIQFYLISEIWYCSEGCEFQAEQDDYVLNHTKALMLEGMNHLIRRMAVREGDGPAMIDDWKADLLQFWCCKHPKYFINAHYLLACELKMVQSIL